MTRPARIAPLAVFCLAALGLAGCSRGAGDVSGKVTYKGKKVVTGTVIFLDTERVSYQGTITEGEYRIEKKIPAGEALVAVISPDPSIKPKGKGHVREWVPPPADVVKRWFPLPPEAGEHPTSELTFVVQPGENTYHIEVKAVYLPPPKKSPEKAP